MRCAALLFAIASVASAAAHARGYTPQGTCEGWPRVALKTPKGFCVALVADERDGLRMPRRLLEVAPGRFWIIDMGSWERRKGRLLEMTLAAPGERPAIRVLAERLDRPLALVRGPDARLYVGEAGVVWRTVLPAPGGDIQREDVITGLPDGGSHPLKELAFGDDRRLYVGVGSASDACRDNAQRHPVPCPERAGVLPRAAVYEVLLAGPSFTLRSLRPHATGLRNSIALAFVPGTGVMQGENSIDYPDEKAPAEELNRLRDGSDHGWPYCVENRRAARGYEQRVDCAKTTRPAALWPAHAAPLSMVWADRGPMKGQLVVAWHGHRAGGQRVVGVAIDAQGKASKPQDWISGWTASPGVRPRGTPAGVSLDAQGRLWVVEDQGKTVLMLGRESPR
jgi:glucose/arabinose dehydrogenase